MLRRLIVGTVIVVAVGFGIRGHAGGVLETLDITGNVPSPVPGQIIARIIGMQWDVRTIPVQFRVNDTQDPIPNPLGLAFLSVADARTVLQRSLNAWNDIPTSFIQMQIVGTSSNAGLVGFDMVNEISFRTAAAFGAIASSPSVTLIRDTVFTPGMNIDADADSDVAAGITVATDVDLDGDLEFPPGLYKAGTILDNDVQFNTKASNGLRFTVLDAEIDTTTRSVDLMAVAVHEFGHSFGLSHDMNNQTSAVDGDGSTMFPFIDTGDPDSEFAQRSPAVDDIAWASYRYPEGTASAGPPALQPGDVAFNRAFGLITGQVWHRFPGQPVAGASVSARDANSGDVLSSGFSGTTRFSFNPANGGLFLLGPAFNIVDGRYTIPVPRGAYTVAIEPVDGLPVPSGSISFTTQLGTIFGQQNFGEEFYNRSGEGDIEMRSGQASRLQVNAGETQSGIDIATGRTINVNMFGNRNAVGFGGPVPAGLYYAVRIPAATLAAINPGEDILIKSAAFDTLVTDASVPAVFAEAVLTTGVVNADGSIATVDLASPLARAEGFLAQDNDFAPFHFRNPQDLGQLVRSGIESGAIQNLFLVLRVPTTTPYPGVSAQPPFIGLDGPAAGNDVPIFGLSYTSADGGVVFNRNNTFNFRFSLVLSEPVSGGNPFVQTFNVPSAPCNGLELDGVTYGFSIGGAPSADCTVGTIGPGVTNNIQPPNIEGNATGVLALTFANPTSTFGFGVAHSTAASPQPQSVIVDLFSPGVGTLRQELLLTTTSDPNFVGGRFDYNGPAVQSATIRFSGAFARFVIDGVTYQLPGR